MCFREYPDWSLSISAAEGEVRGNRFLMSQAKCLPTFFSFKIKSRISLMTFNNDSVDSDTVKVAFDSV